MNIDELTAKIRTISSEKAMQDLADCIEDWKKNEDNALKLRESVEHYIRNYWNKNDNDRQRAYQMWSEFRKSAIDGINGMTMNERLYWFGMFDLFDNSRNHHERQKFYIKLMARK